MNRDDNLKAHVKKKLILLICGDPSTGKKSFVTSWLKGNEVVENSKTYYNSYSYTLKKKVDDEEIDIDCEIRILNSNEIDTEIKVNKTFFEDAFGAFVITSIDEENTFSDAKNWKEKIDLMCILPNKFPLPVFLLINKCDLLNEEKLKFDLQGKNEIEKFTLANQFFKYFQLSCKDNTKEELNLPLNEMIDLILSFNDIKRSFKNISNKKDNGNENEKNTIYETGNKKKCIIY